MDMMPATHFEDVHAHTCNQASHGDMHSLIHEDILLYGILDFVEMIW